MTPLSHPLPHIDHFAASLRAGGWQPVSPGEVARGARPHLPGPRPAFLHADDCLRFLPVGVHYAAAPHPTGRSGGLSRNSCASESLMLGGSDDSARDDADALHAPEFAWSALQCSVPGRGEKFGP